MKPASRRQVLDSARAVITLRGMTRQQPRKLVPVRKWRARRAQRRLPASNGTCKLLRQCRRLPALLPP